jgi:hypothetical protein
MMILNPLKKLQRNSCEESYQQKSDKKMEFFTFITVFTNFWPLTFWG